MEPAARKILREEEKVKDLLRCEVTSRNMVLLHALECTFDTQTIPTCTSVMFCTDSICNNPIPEPSSVL